MEKPLGQKLQLQSSGIGTVLTPQTGAPRLQLDHIIPYRQGFELNISPKIIGSRKNLRFILGEENRQKWDKFQPDEVVKSIIGDCNGLQ